MSDGNLRLRFKDKKGRHDLTGLSKSSTVGDLKTKLSQLSNIVPEALKVLNGFPPRLLDLTDNSSELSVLNINSGDVLIVEENESIKIQRAEEVLQHFQAQMNSVSGFLSRKVVPSDNSCLFSSVYFVMNNGKEDKEAVAAMRDLIAAVVMSDPQKYTEAYLGKANEVYQDWIRNKDSWGGGIELAILSTYYEIEICVFNIDAVNITRFGEDQNYKKRVLLIYDGLHYDALMMEPLDASDPVETKFLRNDESILQKGLELTKEAKSSRNYTDVNKFALRCGVCQVGLVGQKEAQEHAQQTGHINFQEF